MRQLSLILTALLGMAAPALAQVTVDLHALDSLPGAQPATKEPVQRPPTQKSPPSRRTATAKPASPKPAPTTPGTATATTAPSSTPAPSAAIAPSANAPAVPPTATPAPPPAALPTATPPTVALAPIAPPPPAAEPVSPPPPPPISDSAATTATAVGAGLRVTFAAGQTDLSPASAAAIKGMVQSASGGTSTSFNVVAYAAGIPEDPSTARRLSLSRALAVRSALMADGVSSARIYVRALGATGGEEAPDRVDLAIMGSNASASDAPAKSPSQ